MAAQAWVACVDQSQGKVTTVRVMIDGPSRKWITTTREYVVDLILKNRLQVHTAYQKPGETGLTTGAQVNVVNVDGAHYLRTDNNRIKADNLGELPNIASCPV